VRIGPIIIKLLSVEVVGGKIENWWGAGFANMSWLEGFTGQPLTTTQPLNQKPRKITIFKNQLRHNHLINFVDSTLNLFHFIASLIR
jgi:hypothetical protein